MKYEVTAYIFRNEEGKVPIEISETFNTRWMAARAAKKALKQGCDVSIVCVSEDDE